MTEMELSLSITDALKGKGGPGPCKEIRGS
jgi:hypothetical protein